MSITARHPRPALRRRRVDRPAGADDDRRRQPRHRGGHRPHPGRRRRATSIAPSPPRAPRSPAGRPRRPPSAPRCLAAIAEQLSERGDELAATISAELGMPIGLSRLIQVGLPTMTFASMPGLLEELASRGDRQLARRPRAARRRRGDHAVELPAAPDRGQGRAGARRRLHRRAQAVASSRRCARSRSRRSATRSGCPRAC